MEFSVKRPKLEQTQQTQDDALNEEMKKIDKNYMTLFFKIEELKLVERYIKEKEIKDQTNENRVKTETQAFDKIILATKVVAYIYDCVFTNHPLYTDRKLHILIPFLRITIDDNYIMLSEVIQIISGLSPKEEKLENKAGPNQNFIAMGTNQST